MIFRQLFDEESSTYTYLLADETSRETVLIDPVDSHLDNYLSLLNQLGLRLRYSLETHVHADHITGSGLLRQCTGAKTAVGQMCGASSADLQLVDGDEIRTAGIVIRAIATPGHTQGSISYLCGNMLFTGDALLINGCGRTDFQGGDAERLYNSITGKLFALADETLVYPGHDYQGRRVSCIGQEKVINPRLAGKSREEFITIMNNLNLPKPRLIDMAVPANRMCGIPEEAIPQG